jgi:hypothetical protein
MNIYSLHNDVLIYCTPQHFKLEKHMQGLLKTTCLLSASLSLLKANLKLKAKELIPLHLINALRHSL